MTLGLVGRKIGMTRVFTEAGESVPVTVVEILDNRIAQIKTHKNDGYAAVQVAVGARKPSRTNKAMGGHFIKAGIEAAAFLKEFRMSEDNAVADLKVSQSLQVDLFEVGQSIDVRGITKGKGFAGTVKRHGFKMQDATHGNSLTHRAPGSIGQCQDPGRVFKGKKMAGRMGARHRTVQSLIIVQIDAEHSVLLIKGAIPGAPGGYVTVLPSIKNKAKRRG